MDACKRRIAAALLGLSFTLPALAVQFSAEDASGRIVTCQSPLLANLPAGTCITIPDATLVLTVTLDPGEDPAILDEVDYVVVQGGKAYHFNPDASRPAAERWQPLESVPTDLSVLAFELPSTQRFPFESSYLWRMVPLGPFYGQKGVQVFVGAKDGESRGYLPSRVKMVFATEE